MAQMIDLDLNPDRRKLRQFGFLATVAFGALAACAWFEVWMFGGGLGESRQAVAGGLAAVAAYALLGSLVFPAANRPLYVGLTLVAFPIGFVLSYVILGFLFFVIIAPIGILMRTFGNDPMHRSLDPKAPSYWSGARQTRGRDSYFRQF